MIWLEAPILAVFAGMRATSAACLRSRVRQQPGCVKRVDGAI
jgi:hypothetical protein